MKDEYICKQDVVDVFNRAIQDVGILDADDIETVFGMLSSADVVQVVRCKDCRNWQHGMVGMGCYWDADYPHQENDFCSRGVRKNNEMD